MALLDLSNRPTRLAAPQRRAFSLARVLDVWRSRQALARLDATRLADLGLDAKTAHKEAQKPVWDVPATWRD